MVRALASGFLWPAPAIQDVSKSLLGVLTAAGSSVSSLESKLEVLNGTTSLSPEVVGRVLQQVENPDIARCFFRWAGKRPGYEHNSYTCSVLLNTFVKSSRYDEAYGLFRGEMSALSPTVVMYTTVITGFIKDGRLDEAFELVEEMKLKGIPLDVLLHSLLIQGMCKKGKVDEALAQFRQMHKDCAPNAVTYNTLMNGLCKAGRLDGAMEVFEGMVKRYEQGGGCEPNVVSYSTIIDALCKHGVTDRATEVFELMQSKGCLPNIITYTSMVDGMSKAGKVDEARSLLVKMEQENLVPRVMYYNNVVDGLANIGRHGEALDLLLHMKHVGYAVNIVRFNRLLHGLHGTVDDVVCYFRRLTHCGRRGNVVTYNIVVHELCKAGRLEEAYAMVATEMVEQGIQQDEVTYACLVDGFCKAGIVAKAYQVFTSMVEKECTPPWVTYHTLLDGFCKGGMPQEAVRTHDAMVQAGFTPSEETYNELMVCVCKAGKWELGLEVYDSMLDRGKRPGEGAFTALLSCLCDQRRLEEVDKLLEMARDQDDIIPSPAACHVVVEFLCSLGEFETAVKKLVELVHMHCVVQESTYAMVLQGLYARKKWGSALKLFETKGFSADSRTYGEFIGMLCRAGRPDGAAKVINRMACLPSPIRPDDSSCSMVLDGLCKENMFDAAMKLMELMESKGCRPGPTIYTLMIDRTCCSGLPREAHRMFEGMVAAGFVPNMKTVHQVSACLKDAGMDKLLIK